MTAPVYVVEEQGGTFAFRSRENAEAFYRAERADRAIDLVLFVAQAPAHLEGDELAEWCASHATPEEVTP